MEVCWCAIVMNKMKDTILLYRTNYFIDIAGAKRSIFAVTKTVNTESPFDRYFVQVRYNPVPVGSATLFEVVNKAVNFWMRWSLPQRTLSQKTALRIVRPSGQMEVA